MATYKVIQDIEAEDKLLGPLTFRQFVYAGITAFCLWFCYVVVAKGVPYLLPIFILPGIVTTFFAFPWSKEQPTELWALARIRFLFKPRRRIWNQDGSKDLVTITVPKKIERIYSDGLSQTEVRSRLTALASTIDSRGWAVKNAAISPYSVPAFAVNSNASGSRLLSPTSMPMDAPAINETYADILDPATSPKAEQFDQMLEAQAQQHRQQIMSELQSNEEHPQSQNNPNNNPANQSADYWFMNQPDPSTIPKNQVMFSGQQTVNPGTTSMPGNNYQTNSGPSDDEDMITEQLRINQQASDNTNSRLPTLLPIAEQQKIAEEQARMQADKDLAKQQAQAVTPQPDAAILDLARNDDLNISTLAREAKKAHGEDPDNEVVIALR